MAEQKLLILLLLITILQNLIHAKKEICYGLNEQYEDCGTRCPLTCDNFTAPALCTSECLKGCFCKTGYVRNSNDQCVPPEDCAENKHTSFVFIRNCTNPFEEFNKCGPGCQNTCKNRNANLTCTKQCAPGCFCIAGYVRDRKGRCIYPEDCPSKGTPTCPKSNEEYRKCGSGCQMNCKRYGTSFECQITKCVAGCYCQTGLVKDENGDCIRPEFCEHKTVPDNEWVKPNRCYKPNEELRFGNECHLTCKNYKLASRKCVHRGIMGCYCREGYVRDDDQNCILPINCPEDIQGNCEVNLDKLDQSLESSEESSKTTCIKNKSVMIKMQKHQNPPADIVLCDSVQEKFGCGSPCDTTCSTLGRPCKKMSKTCVKKCYCKSGFARDHRNKCVPISLCPMKCDLKKFLFFFPMKNIVLKKII